MTTLAWRKDDMYGCRARIGYTSPPLTTEVFPYEFYKMAPDGVSLVITTLAVVEHRLAQPGARAQGATSELDQSYEISMRAAREMAAAGVDIVVLGGVPINLSRGHDNAQSLERALEQELGVKVSTSLAAQSRAAKTLGCRKAVVAQPYEEPESARLSSYAIQYFGCEVLGAAAWGSPFNQIGRIPRQAALDMGRRLARQHPDADTILLLSPHWPTASAIEPLEREFGMNVMTAQQAVLWDALRRTGIDDRIEGYGRLFRDF